MDHHRYWVPVSIGLVGHAGRGVHGAGEVSTFDGHSAGDSGTRSNSLMAWNCILILLTTYLHLLLAQRNTINNARAGALVWFRIALIFCL